MESFIRSGAMSQVLNPRDLTTGNPASWFPQSFYPCSDRRADEVKNDAIQRVNV